jgi:small subunit ribosomal protein S18
MPLFLNYKALALALALTLELRSSPFLLALGPPPLTSKPPMTTEGKLKRSRNPLDFDFTEPEALTRYVTETGKILPRKLTGLTARQQRHIAKAVKRARNMITMK